MFTSTSLAARVERAECRLLVDGAHGCARRRAGVDVFVRRIAGGAAIFTVPDSPLNKVAGLGFAGPLDEQELAAVEAAFAERGSPVAVELATLADPTIGAVLTRRGYTLLGFENVLGRGLAPDEPPVVSGELRIDRSGEGELDTCCDVVVTGFATPDAQGPPSHESQDRALREAVIADMAASEGFVRYLARRDGTPAGGASFRTCEGVAQLCGAATLPEHRRRGIQSALLAIRLHDASRQGCDVAVLTAQPGSKSHENAQRQGFELLYSRAVFVREP